MKQERAAFIETARKAKLKSIAVPWWFHARLFARDADLGDCALSIV